MQLNAYKTHISLQYTTRNICLRSYPSVRQFYITLLVAQLANRLSDFHCKLYVAREEHSEVLTYKNEEVSLFLAVYYHSPSFSFVTPEVCRVAWLNKVC